MIIAVIGIIVFFILSGSSDCQTQEMAIEVNSYFEGLFLIVMIFTTIWVGNTYFGEP